jgi:diguanylate cyclase (GGDEF)-like protein
MHHSDENNVTVLIARLRAEFVERTWVGIALMAALAAIAISLRAQYYLGWTWTSYIALCLVVLVLVMFFLRYRLGPRMRAVFPVSALMFAAVGSLLRNGIQENGLTYLVMANLLVAMLFGPRAVLAIFIASALVMLGAAAGFISGTFKLRFGLDYPASALAWMFAIVTVFSLAFVVLGGISAYRRSLSLLIERVAAQNEEIAKLADHDPLTGLPSSRLANDRLQMACNQAGRNGERAGLLFIDLDGFKLINDTYGHQAGDTVLKAVATRLSENVRSIDTVARLGGDEFIVVLNGLTEAGAATQVAGKIAAAIAEPVSHAELSLKISASIGIALFPDHAATPERLMHEADQAMYAVKKDGKSGYRLVKAA